MLLFYPYHFFLLAIFLYKYVHSSFMHHVPKGLVIEHGINPILSSPFPRPSSLLYLLSLLLSVSRSLPRSRIVPHLILSHPPSPADPRHRCNVSCRVRARARTFEKPVSKLGIPRRNRRSLVTWVTLFLSRHQRSGISAATAAKGSATKKIARRRPRRP